LPYPAGATGTKTTASISTELDDELSLASKPFHADE